MKYKTLAIFGVLSMVLGYGLFKTRMREMRVTCARTESAFLPVCDVREYFLGLPNGRAQRVDEVTQLANHGRQKRDFFLLQRLPDSRLAPVNLNRVRADGPADRELLTSLNRLAAFFSLPHDERVDVRLSNEAGNIPLGVFFFVLGAALILISRKKSA